MDRANAGVTFTICLLLVSFGQLFLAGAGLWGRSKAALQRAVARCEDLDLLRPHPPRSLQSLLNVKNISTDRRCAMKKFVRWWKMRQRHARCCSRATQTT